MNRRSREQSGDDDLPGILGTALAAGARLTPGSRREEWTREWRAELWHMRHENRPLGRGTLGYRDSLSLAYGMVADAAWLRLNGYRDWWREQARSSAYACLWVLAAYSLLCAVVELVAAGSWHTFLATLAERFLGSFAFVAVPAVFAAMVTYPLRPLRCHGAHAEGKRLFSARTRWGLFLAAKVILTLLLGFLATVVATEPARAMAGARGAWAADWLELLLSALVATAGLRWALLDQEQRCQRCLRALSQPTRLGPPSRNFLEWSGTELICADGHGRLQVPEMQGSWCWFDRWLELDAAWARSGTGLFGG